jgi:hypothetical protein
MATLLDELVKRFQPAAPVIKKAVQYGPQVMQAVTNPMAFAAQKVISHPQTGQRVTQARQFSEQRITQPATNFVNNQIDREVGRYPMFNPITKPILKFGMETLIDTPSSFLRGAEFIANPQRRSQVAQGSTWDKIGATGDVAGLIPGLPIGRVIKTGSKGLSKASKLLPDIGGIGKGINTINDVSQTASKADLPTLTTGQLLEISPIPPLRQPGKGVLSVIKDNPQSDKLVSEMLGIEAPNFPNQPGTFNAAPTPKTLSNIKARNIKAEERTAKAEFDTWQRQVFQQSGATQTTGGAIKQATKAIKGNTSSPLSNGVEELRDIAGFTAGGRDVFRNFKAAYGKRFGQAKEMLLDPFDRSKGRFVDSINKIEADLDTNIVKKYGINRGSKESAAIQQFGEKAVDYNSLVKQFGKAKADNIVEANNWFRSQYDRLLDEVNQVRAGIYPNQPDKLIPKRQDYYRHFKEMAEGFQGLKNIFETPAGISSNLSGVSQGTKPKSKFLSFAQKRLGGESDIDAVGGFINYAKAAEYAKNIDPNIERFRALAEELRGQTAEGVSAGKLNNFIEFLDDYANDLAGKTNPYDRGLQKLGGRKVFNAINWVNSRVKANVILGNARSSVSQIFNVPQGIASAGPVNSSKGLVRAFAGMFEKNNPMKQSIFLKERYNKAFEKFDRGMLANQKRFAVWMTGALDEVGTKYIWNSHYEKGLREGIENPIKYADETTRNLVAGRGIGEVPLLQKSKAFQLVAPFQLEVANAWWVMKDFVDEKRFGALATLFVANYLFNRGAEKLTGSDVTFDPIQATIEAIGAFNEEDDKSTGALRAGGRLGGEVLSNVPILQSTAALYPEYGFSAGDTQFPTRRDFFGEGDPTRFGSGLLAGQAVTDPIFKLATPFAGGQIKKSIEGISAYAKGQSETPTGRVRYPIKQDTRNAVQSAVFGQYAVPEAQEYFNNMGKSKSEVIYNEFKKVGTPEEKAALWDQMVKEKKITKDNIADIRKQLNDEKLGISDKEKKMRSLGVEDGSRASVVVKEFKKLKTQEEKAALWDKYVKAKIITPEVSKQIKLLLKDQ